jgi:hypothetical protein
MAISIAGTVGGGLSTFEGHWLSDRRVSPEKPPDAEVVTCSVSTREELDDHHDE